MTLPVKDHTAITDLISRHGHLVDGGGLHQLHELFTTDAVFDLGDFGAGVVEGLAALYRLSEELDGQHPVGHHVTNVVLSQQADDRVYARSKGIGINADGTCASVTYEDTVRRGEHGWRISHRRVIAHRRT